MAGMWIRAGGQQPVRGQPWRRWYWNVAKRMGARWWLTPEAEVRRLMRQYSWRKIL